MAAKGTSLAALFDELNRTFFGGRLPRYRVRTWRPSVFLLGRTVPEKRTILISVGLAAEDQRRVLLHEMCHIAGELGHGKEFRAELERLGSMGEVWAVKEAREIGEHDKSGHRPPAAALKYTIVTFVADLPCEPWLRARCTFSRIMGMTPREFLKSYPWARGVWQRERKAILDPKQRRAGG